MRIFSLISLCIVLAVACKTKPAAPAQPPYLANFSMRYMEDKQNIHAEGRIVPKSKMDTDGWLAPKQLSINGSPMKKTDANGMVFIYDGPARPSNHQYIFEWEWDNSQPVSCAVNEIKITNPKFDDETLCHKKVGILRWEGESLGAKETLVLLWEGADGQTTTTEAIGASPVPVLELPAFEVRKVPKGKQRLTVIRKKLFQEAKDGFTMQVQSEFYAKPIEVAVGD